MSEEFTTSDKLEQKFKEERKVINEFIEKNITSKMNDVNNIANLQVHILSQRQRMVDKASEMRSKIRLKNKKLHSTRKSKYRFYKLQYDIKLSDYEIKNHIEADLEDSNNLIKVIENQIQFYKDVVDTLDKSIYMIKYLIEVSKYTSGSF